MVLYDSAYSALNGGRGCGEYTNADGTLAWAQSYLLNSLVDMYRGTHRTSYLNRFVEQADFVLARSDTMLSIADYRGRSTWAWSSTRYSSDGSRASWILHDAIILEPMVRFALIVKEDPALRASLGERAQRYLTVAESAIRKYDLSYRAIGEEGQYLLEPGFPTWFAHDSDYRPMPLNSDAAAGQLHALLWEATGKALYRERALAIARRFKANLHLVDDRYVWRYWGVDGQVLYNDPAWEDISHGSFDIKFVAHLAGRVEVFARVDIDRLSRTLWVQRTVDAFLRFVVTGATDVSKPDSKCGTSWTRRESDASGLWLDVADKSLYDAIYAYLMRRASTAVLTDPVILSGLAKLVVNYERHHAFTQ